MASQPPQDLLGLRTGNSRDFRREIGEERKLSIGEALAFFLGAHSVRTEGLLCAGTAPGTLHSHAILMKIC